MEQDYKNNEVSTGQCVTSWISYRWEEAWRRGTWVPWRCWINTWSLWSLSKMLGISCSPLLLVKPHEPLLPFVFSYSHSFIPFTNDFLDFYSRQGTVLDLRAIPFFVTFQLKWFELQLWGLSCAVSSEPLLVPKHFVFQIKFGRLQLKRINKDVSYGIGSLAGRGSIEFYIEMATQA